MMNAWHQSIERMEYFLQSVSVSVPGLILKCILAEVWIWTSQFCMSHVRRQISLKNLFSGLLPVGSVTT